MIFVSQQKLFHFQSFEVSLHLDHCRELDFKNANFSQIKKGGVDFSIRNIN